MSDSADEGRFQALIEHSLDAIAVVESDGGISYVSPAIARVLGYSREEFIGLEALEIVHPAERDEAMARLAELLERPGGSEITLNRVRHRDGSWRWIETVATNQLENPSIRAVVASFRDSTDRKLAEEALQGAERRKIEFLAMLAHELRNPLAAINNAVQLAQNHTQQNDLAWSHAVIARQAKHLARLIDDLLDVARITHGKIQLQQKECDLASIVFRAVEAVKPLIESKRQALRLAVMPGPMAVRADPMRMEQVFVNLLNNAADYTEERGHIELTVRRDADIIVTVKDDGVGIPAELLPRVFDLFTQGDRSIDRSQGGLGIGLTLARSLVEMHGGAIAATSAGAGKGSEFTVRLPLAAHATTQEPSDETTPPEPGRSLRILVVDDNGDTAIGMAKLMEMFGYPVRVARDGPSAVEAARAEPADVILMDIGLPGMSGYDVARTLRSENCGEDAVLIAISGYGHEQAREHSRAAGFNHHLVKPVNFDTLLFLLTSHTKALPFSPHQANPI